MTYLAKPIRRRMTTNTRLELVTAMKNLAQLANRAEVNESARIDLNRARERIAAALSHINQENDE